MHSPCSTNEQELWFVGNFFALFGTKNSLQCKHKNGPLVLSGPWWLFLDDLVGRFEEIFHADLFELAQAAQLCVGGHCA